MCRPAEKSRGSGHAVPDLLCTCICRGKSAHKGGFVAAARRFAGSVEGDDSHGDAGGDDRKE
eukprot:3954368-Pleurochrysis_carterae.AAC.1